MNRVSRCDCVRCNLQMTSRARMSRFVSRVADEMNSAGSMRCQGLMRDCVRWQREKREACEDGRSFTHSAWTLQIHLSSAVRIAREPSTPNGPGNETIESRELT
jgi:hypothetical protein